MVAVVVRTLIVSFSTFMVDIMDVVRMIAATVSSSVDIRETPIITDVIVVSGSLNMATNLVSRKILLVIVIAASITIVNPTYVTSESVLPTPCLLQYDYHSFVLLL